VRSSGCRESEINYDVRTLVNDDEGYPLFVRLLNFSSKTPFPGGDKAISTIPHRTNSGKRFVNRLANEFAHHAWICADHF
jgi:hypothetical protein